MHKFQSFLSSYLQVKMKIHFMIQMKTYLFLDLSNQLFLSAHFGNFIS